MNKFNFISINEKHENISRFLILKLEKRNFLNILYLILYRKWDSRADDYRSYIYKLLKIKESTFNRIFLIS